MNIIEQKRIVAFWFSIFLQSQYFFCHISKPRTWKHNKPKNHRKSEEVDHITITEIKN